MPLEGGALDADRLVEEARRESGGGLRTTLHFFQGAPDHVRDEVLEAVQKAPPQWAATDSLPSE